jgi:hypothetical protein
MNSFQQSVKLNRTAQMIPGTAIGSTMRLSVCNGTIRVHLS